jgi:hypothetical protein
MAAEYTARIETFVPTILVDHPRLGRARMNVVDWIDEATSGRVIDGPTTPPIEPGASDPPLKDPKRNSDGTLIAEVGVRS